MQAARQYPVYLRISKPPAYYRFSTPLRLVLPLVVEDTLRSGQVDTIPYEEPEFARRIAPAHGAVPTPRGVEKLLAGPLATESENLKGPLHSQSRCTCDLDIRHIGAARASAGESSDSAADLVNIRARDLHIRHIGAGGATAVGHRAALEVRLGEHRDAVGCAAGDRCAECEAGW